MWLVATCLAAGWASKGSGLEHQSWLEALYVCNAMNHTYRLRLRRRSRSRSSRRLARETVRSEYGWFIQRREVQLKTTEHASKEFTKKWYNRQYNPFGAQLGIICLCTHTGLSRGHCNVSVWAWYGTEFYSITNRCESRSRWRSLNYISTA